LFQLIATAALFLAAKSEETPRPLNTVLRASCEIFHKQDISFLSYILPVVSIAVLLSIGNVGAETMEMHKCHGQFSLHRYWFFIEPNQQFFTPSSNSYFWFLSMYILWHLAVLTLDYVEQDWFERYRERVTEAEQLILTTLNFELNVQHPYTPLTSTLNKLGLSQGVLLDVALNLISEG